jgi:Zn finger protein HypA/HybF involved in hydrogenase expression
MTLQVKLQLCDSCARKLQAFRRNLSERAMAAEAARILQSCPECASKLPPIKDGKQLFTKLPEDFEPDFKEQKR